MSDPVKQCINLILDQLNVHDEVIHGIDDWSKDLYSTLNQFHENVSDFMDVAGALIEDQERRISALEAKVEELSSDD